MPVTLTAPTKGAAPPGSAVLTRALTKTYRSRHGAVTAVAGIDLQIDHGELFGLLGPNGAGKSTTL